MFGIKAETAAGSTFVARAGGFVTLELERPGAEILAFDDALEAINARDTLARLPQFDGLRLEVTRQ